MQLEEVVPRLLEVIPASPPKFQEKNRQTLERWLAGTPNHEDIGRLLVGWSSGEIAENMTPEQREAFTAALSYYIVVAAGNPRGNAYFAVRAAAMSNASLPWSDPEFAAEFNVVISSVGDQVVGAGRRTASDALLRLKNRENLPSATRETAETVLLRFVTENEVSHARSAAPERRLPPSSGVKPVCDALRELAPKYLDPQRLDRNNATFRAAEQTPTAANLTQLDFLSSLVFIAMHRRWGGSVFRVDRSDLLSARIVAEYLEERPLPNNASRQGTAFMILLLSMSELDEKSVGPADVAERIQSRKWLGAFEDIQNARETIIRFGNDYMQRGRARKELEVNGVIAWLRL